MEMFWLDVILLSHLQTKYSKMCDFIQFYSMWLKKHFVKWACECVPLHGTHMYRWPRGPEEGTNSPGLDLQMLVSNLISVLEQKQALCMNTVVV